MSELINTHDNRATIRWKLLTGASALALTAYVSSGGLAKAEDAGQPQIWIELGGQMERDAGLYSPFTAPFMSSTPVVPPICSITGLPPGCIVVPPDTVSAKKSFGDRQAPPRFAFGENGKITFQPEDSDWLFSASIRYGRSHNTKHSHYQGPAAFISHSAPVRSTSNYAAPFSRLLAQRDEEHHAILDFSAGKDIGSGCLGHDGSSTLSAGVRLVQLSEKIRQPSMPGRVSNLSLRQPSFPLLLYRTSTFNNYSMTGHAARSFSGVGPSLSWNASAVSRATARTAN